MSDAVDANASSTTRSRLNASTLSGHDGRELATAGRAAEAQRSSGAVAWPAEFDRVADDAVRDCVRLQEDLGCDLVTDGELRRDNFYSFVADKLTASG